MLSSLVHGCRIHTGGETAEKQLVGRSRFHGGRDQRWTLKEAGWVWTSRGDGRRVRRGQGAWGSLSGLLQLEVERGMWGKGENPHG